MCLPSGLVAKPASAQGLLLDAGDLDAGQFLAVTLALLVAGLVLELLDDDLRARTGPRISAVTVTLARAAASAVTWSPSTSRSGRELEGAPGSTGDAVDGNEVSNGNLLLPAACADNRVHLELTLSSILMRSPGAHRPDLPVRRCGSGACARGHVSDTPRVKPTDASPSVQTATPSSSAEGRGSGAFGQRRLAAAVAATAATAPTAAATTATATAAGALRRGLLGGLGTVAVPAAAAAVGVAMCSVAQAYIYFYPVLYVHDLENLLDPASATVLSLNRRAFSSQEVPELLLVGVAPKSRESEYTPFPSGICCRINGSTAGRATNMPLFGQSAQASYQPALQQIQR